MMDVIEFDDDDEPDLPYVPSGRLRPLDSKSPGHREVLRNNMRTWLQADPSRKIRDLMDLIETRYRMEKSDPDAELPMKISTLRAFLARPESQSLSGLMNTAYHALDQEKAWNSTLSVQPETVGGQGLYQAMVEFMRVPELTSVALLRRVPGVYRIYRPILTHPGCFVVGFVVIQVSEETGALTYREYNRVQRTAGREEKVQELFGYAFKKSAMVYMLASDALRHGMHLTILTGQEKAPDDHYRILSGGFIDTMGNQSYSGRVFMERMPDVSPSHEKRLRAMEAESVMLTDKEIPPSILAFFRGRHDSDVQIF